MSIEALSLDDAVAQITNDEPLTPEVVKPDEVIETQEPTATNDGATDAAETEGGVQAPDDADTLETANDGGLEDADDTVQPSIEAPTSWTAEAKAAWETVPDDLKPILANVEAKRQTDTAQAFAKIAAREREVEARLAQNQTVPTEDVPALSQKAELARANYQQRYNGVDWSAARAQLSPDEFATIEAMEKADRQSVADAQGALESRVNADAAYWEGQRRDAAERFPGWYEPTEDGSWKPTDTGVAELTKVRDYIVKDGLPAETFDGLSSQEVGYLHKAMLYDQGKAALEKAKPKIAPKVAKPAAKSGANTNQQLEALRKKAMKSGNLDDMTAYNVAKNQAAA